MQLSSAPRGRSAILDIPKNLFGLVELAFFVKTGGLGELLFQGLFGAHGDTKDR